MALSVVDLYKNVLPKTNCGDCGYPTCLAFASIVVSEKLPLKNCPHIAPDLLAGYQAELDEQYAAGKWLKRDMAQDALDWARQRASSMALADLPGRIGGRLIERNGKQTVELPYFTGKIVIQKEGIRTGEGQPLNRWEQVFVYNHMAQGGSAEPTGSWKALEQIPNTISKIKSMKDQVETLLIRRFAGRMDELAEAARSLGGIRVTDTAQSADAAFLFKPLPKIPIMLLFWDEDREEGFEARAKLLFDETITEHLDIESILFLSERLRQLLCSEDG